MKKNTPLEKTDGFSYKCLPDWVKESPIKIRHFIIQEYYVSPERARFFLDNANKYEDIKRLRKELYVHSSYPSSSSLENIYSIDIEFEE